MALRTVARGGQLRVTERTLKNSLIGHLTCNRSALNVLHDVVQSSLASCVGADAPAFNAPVPTRWNRSGRWPPL